MTVDEAVQRLLRAGEDWLADSLLRLDPDTQHHLLRAHHAWLARLPTGPDTTKERDGQAGPADQ